MACAILQTPSSRIGRVQAPDGLELAVEAFGAPDRPGLVFAHGFGQTRQAWAGSAAAIADRGWHAVSYDARGHGDSGWRRDDAVAYAWPQMVDDLVAVVRTLHAP